LFFLYPWRVQERNEVVIRKRREVVRRGVRWLDFHTILHVLVSWNYQWMNICKILPILALEKIIINSCSQFKIFVTKLLDEMNFHVSVLSLAMVATIITLLPYPLRTCNGCNHNKKRHKCSHT
jgi:hypothetical protein